ncbi:phage tail protein [Lactiplantibacillus plantarum]|uniref:phage tail protein n=1 Tax=Lactiplantibacillus plantarum TaxID=1590 RepID=UPI00193A316E|nr:phage tail protein [Lactiplantibacillus plantarum]QRG93724.1 phage tail protein [Lactiplantibacillus plantarum]QRG93765.1 phage tail protein [Lactiplantibacillus plantarum]
MDILITKLDGHSVSLSSIGLQVIDIKETAPTISRIAKSFDGRNGSLDYGGRHIDKKVMVSAMYGAIGMSEDAKIESSVNSLTSQIEPFYITKFLNDGPMYHFERPGQTTNNLIFANGNEDYKRYKVFRSDTNNPEFKGRIGDKLLSTIDLEFTTVGLPYGESKPRSQTLVSGQSITYNGTVACSQLEQAFYFVVTAKVASAGGFTLTVDGQSLIVTSPVVAGDVYTLSGMNNTRGNQNINDKTNAGYFILHPGAANKVVCSISADIQIKNLCDLYI